MEKTVTIIGAAALPVGKWQSAPEAAVQVLDSSGCEAPRRKEKFEVVANSR